MKYAGKVSSPVTPSGSKPNAKIPKYAEKNSPLTQLGAKYTDKMLNYVKRSR
jgi:hypothetical protein